MNRKKLTEQEVLSKLSGIPGWSHKNDRLFREFKFSDFSKAFGFMASAAVAAEAMNHHPNWSNVYNRVSVELFTHDAGGITEFDFVLAAKMNDIAGF